MKHKTLWLSLAVAGFFLLHQDYWFWKQSRPLLFGCLPVGLWYHAAYCLGAAALMALLVRFAWPRELDLLEAHDKDQPPPA